MHFIFGIALVIVIWWPLRCQAKAYARALNLYADYLESILAMSKPVPPVVAKAVIVAKARQSKSALVSLLLVGSIAIAFPVLLLALI